MVVAVISGEEQESQTNAQQKYQLWHNEANKINEEALAQSSNYNMLKFKSKIVKGPIT